MKPFDGVWLHYTKVSNGKVACKYCDWVGLPHATRMRSHLVQKHSKEAEEAAAEEPAPSSSKKQCVRTVQTSILAHLDPPFSMQAAAELRHTYAMVMNGWSANSQTTPWSKYLFQTLRADYKVPTCDSFKKHIFTLFSQVKALVEARLAAKPLRKL
jgi:hypothetical protein